MTRFKVKVGKYSYAPEVLSFVCVSDGVRVKDTWHINFNSEVVLERQVHLLNQPGELGLGKCIPGQVLHSARTAVRW